MVMLKCENEIEMVMSRWKVMRIKIMDKKKVKKVMKIIMIKRKDKDEKWKWMMMKKKRMRMPYDECESVCDECEECYKAERKIRIRIRMKKMVKLKMVIKSEKMMKMKMTWRY